jgi:signal transduction histidine kinase
MPEPGQSAAREDILIVEDSGVYISFFKTVFAASAYSYSIITNGTAAWEKLQSSQPKILLLDWNLPGMDGVTICRRLRELKRPNYLFVIMLTSMQRLEDIMTGFDAGADDYMVKPFEPAVLKAKIKVGMRLCELEAANTSKVELLARANQRQESLISRLEEKNQLISKQAQDIHEAQMQLVETARRAGMAEIATSVLHNVGNLLNTAMTSSTIIREVVGHSKISTLTRLAELLGQQTDFPRFIQADARGGKVPMFLTEIASVMAREHQLISDKLHVLAESQEQIRQIIALQQTYAGVAGVKDAVSLSVLIGDATRLFVESFKKHDIEIECAFAPELPLVNVEKHKLLQILINLLQNARDATKTLERGDRRIHISASLTTPDTVAITLADNGVGIRPENLERIFNFGFTTKPNGHGFGLHGCANLAREMGGALTVASPGHAQGATFTLSLPVK